MTYKHLSHHEKSTHYASASNVSPVLAMKRPAQMMIPGMDNGLESFMLGNKKLAVQSYLGPNPIKYEEDNYSESHSLEATSQSDGSKGEFNIRLAQPAMVQPPSLNFEDTMKSALIGQLAENQRLKKEFMLTMNFLQGNLRNNSQVRNQAFLTSAYQSLMQPLSI